MLEENRLHVIDEMEKSQEVRSGNHKPIQKTADSN
jgi:hypothetical protein